MTERLHPIEECSAFAERYELIEALGQGGFARVFRARQRSTGQSVAVKILEDDGAGGRLAEVHARRFQREMELCAGLHHLHVVGLIDGGEADGWLYGVFAFVPGRSLGDLLRDEGALLAEEAARLMGQVLDAIGYAHDQGVIHRDLTPANVMVTDAGLRRNALVLDFGISAFSDRQRREEMARLTATHEAIGTPSYAAPEQLRGEPPTVKTDLYSWGLVLLECLTGEKPIRGESLQEQLAQQLGPSPVEIPEAVRALPIHRVLARALAKSPPDRAASAAELMELLRATTSPLGATGAGEAGRQKPVTALSVRASFDGEARDPSEAERRLRAFQRRADAAVRSRGGFPVAVVGARVVALFGYSEATEQAARAALEAAMRIRDGAPEGARVHAGVRSGQLAVPGEGAASAHEPAGSAVVDEAVALEGRTSAGEVWACAETRRRLRGDVPLEHVPEESAAGPPAFRLLEGIDALRGAVAAATPMIGRARELARLEDAWQEVRRGRPQSVLVVGEAGIGKSRLVLELRRKLDPASWIVWRCTPESQHSPLRPIAEWLAARAREIKLDVLLAELDLDVGALHPLLAELAGLSFHPDHPPRPLPPRRKRELVLEAILAVLSGEARRQPQVLLVEDLHWADATTRELLLELVRRVRSEEVFGAASDLPLLTLLTARPSFEPPWSLTDVQLVQLARLTPGESEALARALREAGAHFEESEIGPLVERAGGVPFFLEEMARMARQPRVGEASPAVPMPETLRDLLDARIAGLRTGVRETAQRAACVGREFELDLLAAVAGCDEEALRDDLADLGRQGIAYRRPGLGAERYVFHHALLSDTARESMQPEARRDTHLRIATCLTALPFEQVADQHPERVAYHFEEGGDLGHAIDFRQRAAFRAVGRSAHPEAIHHYERALDMLMKLPAGAERDHAERSLRIALGSAYMTTQGYAAEPVERSFERALELCNRYSEAPRLFSALNGLWAYHLVRGDAAQTPALVERMQEVAERSGSERRLLFARHAAGATAFYSGRLAEALPLLVEATELYEKASTEPRTGPAWQRHAGTAPMYLGWCLHLMGKPDQALARKTRGLELAGQLGDVDAQVEAMTYGVALHHDRREPDEALALSDRIVPLAEEYGLEFWLGIAKAARGWASCHAGDVEAGLVEIDEGLAIFHRSGALVPLVYRACHTAEAQLLAGDAAAGISALDDALERARGRFDRYYDAEAFRLRGELLRLDGDTAAAEREFERAAELARMQGARLFELRAAASRVRLLEGTRRADPARDALASVYAGFDEGLDLADLTEARVLLEGAAGRASS